MPTATLTEPTTAQTNAYAPLSLADRCDSCIAQALVRATFPTGALYFCNHHGTRFMDSLVAQGALIHTEQVGIRVNDTDH